MWDADALRVSDIDMHPTPKSPQSGNPHLLTSKNKCGGGCQSMSESREGVEHLLESPHHILLGTGLVSICSFGHHPG